MATLITGPDPNAAAWPIPLVPTKAITRPSGYTTTGATEAAVIASLADNNSATYIQSQNADNYWRYQVSSVLLPFGARVTSVTPSVIARQTATNARNDWLVFQGDHSGVKFAIADHLPAAHYPMTSGSVRTFSGPAVTSLTNKQLITQADLERGLYVAFGFNTVYGKSTANPILRVTEAKLQLTYDMAPTAVITSPTGTVNDTASPLITWDYFDDFRPQAAYALTLTNAAGAVVYSSGKVTSSDTSHAVAMNLPNDTYTVSLQVFQAWNGPGGAFPSLSNATATFTVSVLRLSAPVIASAITAEQIKITVTPNINLLNSDDASFDRGVLALSGFNATVVAASTPVLNGTGSAKVTVTGGTGTSGISGSVLGRVGSVAVSPGQAFDALIYLNPLALAGRSARISVRFFDASGASLGGATGGADTHGATIVLTTNTWNQLFVRNSVAPANAASVRIMVELFGTVWAVNDVCYLDNAAVFHYVAGAPLPAWSRGGFYENTPNVLSYDDSTLEGDGWVWAPTPDANTSVAVTSAQAAHGSRSLVVNRTVATVGINYAAATVGLAAHFPCTPGETLRGFFASRAATTARTVSLNLDFYDANNAAVSMPGGATNTVATMTNSTTAWVTPFNGSGTIVVPANAVGFRVSVLALVASGTAFPANELHYFDAIAVYRSTYDQGFVPGYLPNTDEAPLAVVEYTEDATTWTELARSASALGDTTEVFYDYTARAGVPRTYRAYLTETENDIDLTSDYSATTAATVALRGVWLATAADPVNTSHQFVMDGLGRSQSVNARPNLYEVDGRSYPFAEFGDGFDQSLPISLQLTTAADQAALLTLAKSKAEVLFRDQRGRSVRGVMGTVEFTDEVWGQTAKFTIQATGQQP